MKKIYLIALFAGISFCAAAQQKATTAEARALSTSKQMMSDLRLDEGAYIKVKNLYLKHYAQQQEIEKAHPANKAQQEQRLQQLNASLQAELMKVLQADQYNAYQKMTSSH